MNPGSVLIINQQTAQSAEAKTGSISTTVEGTGNLSAGTTANITAPVGVKVKEVLVKSGDAVTEGQTIATLDEASIASQLLAVKNNLEDVKEQIDELSSDAADSSTTEYLEAKVLNGELTDLQEAQSALTQLMETKTIIASCAGTINEINVTADSEIAQSSQSGSNAGSDASSGSSSSTGSSDAGTENMSASTGASGGNTGIITLGASVDSAEANSAAIIDTGDTKIEECNLQIKAPATGESPQKELEETEQYAGSVSWNCSTSVFQPGTVYTATIKLTVKAGYAFSQNIIPSVKDAVVSYEVLENDSGESVLRITAKYAKTTEDSGKNSGTDSSLNQSTGAVNSGTDNSKGSASSDALVGNSSGSGSSTGSATGTAGASDANASSGSSDNASSDYSGYEATAFTIASDSDVSVSINVDELDISSVKKGQTAAVTLDALEGEAFEGTITKVSTSATSGSSSAKYAVDISLDKTEGMLLGMSASATISIDAAENAVLIPVNALQEKGNSIFVYTGKDADGNLTDEVEVETGLSNGNKVEIVSGLKTGDTVYYMKAESTDSADMAEGTMGTKGGQTGEKGDMSGGQAPSGEKPSTGQAPSGMPESSDE